MIVAELLTEPVPARMSDPQDWMSTVQPGQLRLRPMIGLGITLSMISVVGEPLTSAAASPAAQPGNPPDGVQTAPLVSVQLPDGGGAVDVTLYGVPGTHTA